MLKKELQSLNSKVDDSLKNLETVLSMEQDMGSITVLEHFKDCQSLLTSSFIESKESINLTQNLKNAEKSSVLIDS